MTELQGIFCSDDVARDGTRFSIGALDEMVWQGSDGGRPSNLSHDAHRPIGWSIAKGLYMSHEGSYVIGNTYIPNDENESAWLQSLVKAFSYKTMVEAMAPNMTPFEQELTQLGIIRDDIGKFFYNNIALYTYDNILYAAFPELKNSEDGDGLILLETLLNRFEYKGQGVFIHKRNKLAILLHSFFRRSYSICNNYNFGFLEQLFEVYKSGNHSIKVRLEPNFIGYAPSWRKCHEYEYWYGPHYTDDIANIPDGLTRYQSGNIEKVYTNVQSTEFIWTKKADENLYQFEMEEVMKAEAPTMDKDTYGCRYLHSLYDLSKGEFCHFDGAIRSYDLEKIMTRIETPMDKMGHQAKYTKIFRLDGHLPLSMWKLLITQYLCSNFSVYDYFGIPRPFQEELNEKPVKSLQDYVPYPINKGDGIRLFVSYHQEEQYSTPRCFCRFDEITLADGQKFASIDFSAIEVVKALRKIGVEISLPTGVKITRVADNVHNVPCIFHSDTNGCFKDINKTLDGIRLLVAQHVQNNDDEIYSFTIGWNMNGRSVTVSFMGHVADLRQWLSSFETIPTKRKDFQKWEEKQNKYIHKIGKDSPLPINAKHIVNDGVLYLRHRPIVKDVHIHDAATNERGEMYGRIETKDEVIGELWNAGQIHVAPLFMINGVNDMSTGESYCDSLNSMIFHETQYEVKDFEIVSYVWTTHPVDL